jgi:toxin secretion/phage lysis holin
MRLPKVKMENINKIFNGRNSFCAIIGLIGGIIATELGGWDVLLKALVIFIFIDYLTGLIVAGVFHASRKTETGTLESRTSIKGLFRKICILLSVYMAVQLDLVIGTDFVRNTVIISFIASEGISIVENFGLMGLPMPMIIVNALDVLKKKAEEDAKKLRTDEQIVEEDEKSL